MLPLLLTKLVGKVYNNLSLHESCKEDETEGRQRE